MKRTQRYFGTQVRPLYQNDKIIHELWLIKSSETKRERQVTTNQERRRDRINAMGNIK